MFILRYLDEEVGSCVYKERPGRVIGLLAQLRAALPDAGAPRQKPDADASIAAIERPNAAGANAPGFGSDVVADTLRALDIPYIAVTPGAFVVHPPGEVHEYENGPARTLLFRVRYGADMASRHVTWRGREGWKQSPEDAAYYKAHPPR